MPEILPGVVALPERALWLPDQRALVAGDLHLGYESVAREGGALVPAHQAERTAAVLEALVARHSPEVVVLNGDVKHSHARAPKGERRDLLHVLSRLQRGPARVVIVEGNHDGGLRHLLPGADVREGLALGDAWITHGHLPHAPPPGTRLLVVSHEHPAVVVPDGVGVAHKYPAFLADSDGGAVVLPALSPWATGVDVLAHPRFFGATLARHDSSRFAAHAVTEAGVLDFGKVGPLRRVVRGSR